MYDNSLATNYHAVLPRRKSADDRHQPVDEPFCRKSTTVEAALQRINGNPYFRGRDLRLQFELRDDELVVSGHVPSFYIKQLIQSTLHGLPGVRRIDNRIEVVSSVGLSSEPVRT